MPARAGIGTILDMDRYGADGRTITCADCGRDFEFTAEQQRFHRGMGFADPLRCAACLAMRRARYRPEHRRPQSNPGSCAPTHARLRPRALGARETDPDEGSDRGRNRHDGRGGRRAHTGDVACRD
jgi:hypothetical protein